MSHKKKEWTLKELEEKKQRFLKRHADLNPESVRNRTILVTGHHGLRSWIIYHGNNMNNAKDILASQTCLPFKSVGKTGGNPRTVKLWHLGESRTQPLEVFGE
jgi:hypothetical protein